MGQLWDYDGAVFKNELDHSILLVPFRADGLLVDTNNPVIAPGEYRLINNDHIGDAEFYIVLAFMAGAEIPPRVGVTQGVEGVTVGVGLGGGGSAGGEGGSASIALTVGVTKTAGFSSTMAAGLVQLTKNSQRNRYENSDDFKVTSQPANLAITPGRDVTVNGQTVDPNDTQTLKNIQVWSIQRIGARNRAAEEKAGRSSKGW